VWLNLTPPLRHHEQPDPGSHFLHAATGGALDCLIRWSSAPIEQIYRRGLAQSSVGCVSIPGCGFSEVYHAQDSTLQGGCRASLDRAKSSRMELVRELAYLAVPIKFRRFDPDVFRHRLLLEQRLGRYRDGYANPGYQKQRLISVTLW